MSNTGNTRGGDRPGPSTDNGRFEFQPIDEACLEAAKKADQEVLAFRESNHAMTAIDPKEVSKRAKRAGEYAVAFLGVSGEE